MHSVAVKMNDNGFLRLNRIAKDTHKSKAEIIGEAIKVRLSFEEYEHRAIMKGLRQADNGETITHAEMLDFLDGLDES